MILSLLTLYSIVTHFDTLTTRQLLKTLWEKKKLLLTSNFFFSHNVFLLNQIIVSPFVHVFDTIFSFAAEVEEPKIAIFGKGLTQDKILALSKLEAFANDNFIIALMV